MHPIDFRVRQQRQDNPADYGAVGIPDEPVVYIWDELEDALPRRFCFGAGMAYGVILGIVMGLGLAWMVLR